MDVQTITETGWRGPQDVWLEAAFESLIDGGVEAVRIQLLAKKLKLSRTSFYWFFKDREQLLEALLERWWAKNTGSVVRQSQAYAESIVEATLNVFDCWHDPELFDSQCEYAIRSWALQSPEVAAKVYAADKMRLDALKQMFLCFGYEDISADVRARTIYLTQIGYISMKTEEDAPLRMKRIPDYVEIFTGQRPKPRDLDRFFARRGYDPRAESSASGEVSE